MVASRRYDFIEVARVVCILLVVLAHASDYALAGGRPTSLTMLESPFIRFVVPAFFMISGLLLGVRHRDPGFTLGAGAFWHKRLRTLVLPFVVWNLIYMVVFTRAYHEAVLGGQNLFAVTTGYIHLFFILVLLQCLALYTLLARRFSERLLKVSVVLAAASSLTFYVVAEVLLWTRGADGHWFEWHIGKLVFGWALFFFWGLWLGYRKGGERGDRDARHARGDRDHRGEPFGTLAWLRRHRYWLALAALVAFVPLWLETRLELSHLGAVANDYFLLTGLVYEFVAANALIGLLYGWESRIGATRAGRVVVSWGALMFGVYVSHLVIVHYLSPYWQAHLPGTPMALQIAVVTLTAFAGSLAFVWLCGTRLLWPVGAILFGGRGRPARR